MMSFIAKTGSGALHVDFIKQDAHDADTAWRTFVLGKSEDFTRAGVVRLNEESGRIVSGKFEWSFGNGASGSAHANSGYTMMATGLRIDLAAYRDASAPGTAKVNIVINGIEQTSYGVKLSGQYSGTTTFATHQNWPKETE